MALTEEISKMRTSHQMEQRPWSVLRSDSCFDGWLSPTLFSLLVPGHSGVPITQEGEKALRRQIERCGQSVSMGRSGDNVPPPGVFHAPVQIGYLINVDHKYQPPKAYKQLLEIMLDPKMTGVSQISDFAHKEPSRNSRVSHSDSIS